jgi:hypothetical protein
MRINGIGKRVQTSHFLFASYEPADSSLGRLLYVFIRRGIFNTLVKSHCDSGTEMRLDLHALLGSHKNTLTVNVGSKFYAFLGNLAELGKREDLESATIGKDGAAPIHKFMKTAHLVDKLISGTDVKVISIRKFDLTAYFSEVFGRNSSLDCGTSADIHKHGGLDITVNGVEDASAGFAFLFQKLVHINSS